MADDKDVSEQKPPPASISDNNGDDIKNNLVCAVGGVDANISESEIRERLGSFLDSLGGDRLENVLLLPPDHTRFHSRAGPITRMIYEYFSSKEKKPKMTVLPALGTHAAMTKDQLRFMFGDVLADADPSPFVEHDWRRNVVTIGHVPAKMVEDATDGMVKDTPWPAQLNRLVWEGGHDLVLSIGQVVPHEVMGMANFNKNLFVGVGGVEAINLSHFVGAVHGMERMMGRADNPLRRILNHASEEFLQKKLPLWYVLTVIGTDDGDGDDGTVIKGFYIGRDIECYNLACDLSLKVNFTMLETPLSKVVVWLDESEFHSTWLGNKSIYRTRMAIADGGELVVLAPGVKRFGEDDEVDELIRKHGYRGTPATLEAREKDENMRRNLSAVAHLIHGSTEGRFRVTYCTNPDLLTKKEVEGVGFAHAELDDAVRRYHVDGVAPKDGPNATPDGEEFYYINNPALGLWAVRSRFEGSGTATKEGTKNPRKRVASDVLEPQNASDQSGGVGGWKKPPPV